MAMHDKIQKLNTYCFLGYFLMAIISVVVPIPQMAINLLGIAIIIEMYGSRVVIHYLKNKKISKIMVTLLMIYLVWNGLLLIYDLGEASRLVTMILAYTYIIVADKLNQGKISMRFVRFAVFFLGMEVLRYFFKGSVVTAATLLTQAGVVFIMIDPIMNNIAKKGAAQRGEVTEKVPLIRRILFGKTGKLRMDILKDKEEPGSALMHE